MFTLQEVRQAAIWSRSPEMSKDKQDFAIQTIFETLQWYKIGEDNKEICKRVNNCMKEKFGGHWWSLARRTLFPTNKDYIFHRRQGILIELMNFNFLLFQGPRLPGFMIQELMNDERIGRGAVVAREITRAQLLSESSSAVSLKTVPTSKNAITVIQDSTANSNARACVICLINERKIMLKPCNHFVTCQECSGQIHNCPVCRREINDFETVFMS
uniref:RING-type domain-containing protein n=1 Tax=Panagrolaimus sp. PS1159 TaxID=55785 RepID=A0AC35FHQ2_9BILA